MHLKARWSLVIGIVLVTSREPDPRGSWFACAEDSRQEQLWNAESFTNHQNSGKPSRELFRATRAGASKVTKATAELVSGSSGHDLTVCGNGSLTLSSSCLPTSSNPASTSIWANVSTNVTLSDSSILFVETTSAFSVGHGAEASTSHSDLVTTPPFTSGGIQTTTPPSLLALQAVIRLVGMTSEAFSVTAQTKFKVEVGRLFSPTKLSSDIDIVSVSETAARRLLGTVLAVQFLVHGFEFEAEVEGAAAHLHDMQAELVAALMELPEFADLTSLEIVIDSRQVTTTPPVVISQDGAGVEEGIWHDWFGHAWEDAKDWWEQHTTWRWVATGGAGILLVCCCASCGVYCTRRCNSTQDSSCGNPPDLSESEPQPQLLPQAQQQPPQAQPAQPQQGSPVAPPAYVQHYIDSRTGLPLYVTLPDGRSAPAVVSPSLVNITVDPRQHPAQQVQMPVRGSAILATGADSDDGSLHHSARQSVSTIASQRTLTASRQHTYGKISLLPSSSPEAIRATRLFHQAWEHSTPLGGVIRVLRIENQTIQARFDAYKSALPTPNVRQRFHGTSRECDFCVDAEAPPCKEYSCALCSICAQSFSLEASGAGPNANNAVARALPAGGRYGRGLYFTRASSKANDYSVKVGEGAGKTRVVFLCEVAEGLSVEVADQSIEDAEIDMLIRARGQGGQYDSVVAEGGGDGPLNYHEVVVYDKDAVLPKYLIVYTVP